MSTAYPLSRAYCHFLVNYLRYIPMISMAGTAENVWITVLYSLNDLLTT